MTEPEPTTPATPKNRSQSPESVEHTKLPKTQQARDVGGSRRTQHGQHDKTNIHESNTGAQQPNGPHTDSLQQNNGIGAPSNPHGNDQPRPPPQQ